MTAVQDAPETGPPDAARRYLGGVTAATFAWWDYIEQFDKRLLAHPMGRRYLTREDPLLFALLMLKKHLKSPETGDEISFSDFHLDLCRRVRRWIDADLGPAELRDAFIAPRGSGKSSWLFLILPLWALAHGHRRYIAAFADSASQAEQHLTSLKRELDTNLLLRLDYPDLCQPAMRPKGVAVSDNRSLFIAANGAVFSAKGIDSSALGAKVGSQRPDLLLFDDVEPDESNYSAFQKDKRLSTITNAVFPMNDRAIVLMSGTVTMPGSIFHDLVKTKLLPGGEHPPWIQDENIQVHHYPALITDPETGADRSLWPQRWDLPYLLSIRHTRSFAMNFQNNPLGRDGVYWRSDDFVYAELPALTHQILSIDPAVTSKGTSDYTALAVIGYSAHYRRVVVRAVWAIRVPPGEQLRARVLAILELYPETRGIVVETNQGGDTWKTSVLKDMPVKVVTVHQKEPKEVRAARTLNWYQTKPQRPVRRRVNGNPIDADGEGPGSVLVDLPYIVHERPLPALEEQMVGFPNAAYDDLVDAIGTGADMFLKPKKRASVSVVGPPGADDDDLVF